MPPQDASPDAPRLDTPVPGPGAMLGGRYVLGALLGSGGMGRVYAAHDKKLGREVAVKLLSAPAPDPDALRRFQREALATGSLQHPNVVAVFDVGDELGRPFIVMELLRGANLREKLRAGALPIEDALRVGQQVAKGVAAAHDKGLTHRDLKPENVFITGDGFVKILDFGLVKLTEDLNTLPGSAPPPEPDDASTGAGRMLGTVGYMAPEQVRGRPVDPRADVFNFGAVLYEMLSGERAFRGASPTETGYATLFKKPEPLLPDVPRALRLLVDRCLEKDREQRPSSKEVAAELETMKPPPPRRRRRIPARAWQALGVAIAVASVVVAGLRMRREVRTKHATPPQAGTVAILPFGPRDAPKFGWLSEGVVDLLARDLKGSDLRVVDSASVLRALGGDLTADLDKVRGASMQLGAKYFVLGRIEERKGQLVLEAVLHESGSETPVSEAVAQGDPSQLLRLIRQLSDQLQLRPLAKQEFDARLEILTRQTSRSVPALEAWLEGEQLMRRLRWSEAITALHKAVELDPEFALAQFHLGQAALVIEPGLALDALERALRNSDRLSPPERLLLRGALAVNQGHFQEAETVLIEALRKFPEEPQTWMQLAELYVHQNPLRARSSQEAYDALQHVLVVDPVNTEAISHLVDIAVLRRERALAARLADRMLALADDPAVLARSRLTVAWARSDIAEFEKVVSDLLKPEVPRTVSTVPFVQLEWLERPADAGRLAERLASAKAPADQGWGLYLMAMADLVAGRPETARTEFARAAKLDPSGSAANRAVWVDTLDFLSTTPEHLASARAAAQALDDAQSPDLLPQKEFLIGALAVRAGDAAAAESAAAALERMPPLGSSSITGDLALAIRARLRAAQHEPAAALALLEQQRLRIPARYARYYGHLSETTLRAHLLGQVGRAREALETWDALNVYSGTDPVFLAYAHLEKAALLERAGDRDGAIDQYASFIELWKDCEPAERPEVERARARLAQLREANQRASR